MNRRFFKLIGRVIVPGGIASGTVLLSVLDRDHVLDDFIAAGILDPEGSFAVTFTRESFNQDWFEHEDTPDIYLVLSRKSPGGEWEPFFQQTFPKLAFENGTEDLGTIVATKPQESPSFKSAVQMDFTRVRRVTLDSEVIEHILAEIVPTVEALTGWKNLRDGVKVAVTDDMPRVCNEIYAEALGEREPLPFWHGLFDRISRYSGSGLAALCDPFHQTVWLDRGRLSQAGLDIAKIILGHEFVHVGQFRYCPGELDRYRTSLRVHLDRIRYLHREDSSQPIPDKLANQLLTSFAFMVNLEGYAHYIESEFLRRKYPLQTYLRQVAVSETILAAAVHSIVNDPAKKPPEIPSNAARDHKAVARLLSLDEAQYKNEQYGGHAFYKYQTQRNNPAEYLPSLPENALETLSEIFARAWETQKRT